MSTSDIQTQHVIFKFWINVATLLKLPYFCVRASSARYIIYKIGSERVHLEAISFILLSAEPALNQSICCSFSEWLSLMRSVLPSWCLISQSTGWKYWLMYYQETWLNITTLINVSTLTSSYLARCEVLESKQRDLVCGLDLVVVSGVGECQWQQTLLLQVGLVNPGKDKAFRCKYKFACTLRVSSRSCLGWQWIQNNESYLANDLTMMALPPRCLGSSAACSREDPSP